MACPLLPQRIESAEDDALGDVTAATSPLVFGHLIGRRGERLSANLAKISWLIRSFDPDVKITAVFRVVRL
jgi:hypothetical protein